MRFRLLSLLPILCASFPILCAGPAAAAPIDQVVALYGTGYTLAIRRDGSVIGQHDFTFRRDGGRWQVAIASQAAVKLAFITVFRFTYRSDETWSDGRLTALGADTDDDGASSRVTARAAGDRLQVSGSGGNWIAPPGSFATSHWQRPATGPGIVINTLTGRRNDVIVTDRGEEMVETGVGPIKARRLNYTGELELDSWYEADGRWLGMRFKGQDGSVIDYICTRCGR